MVNERIESPRAVVSAVFPSLRGLRVLDVGCGEGRLVAQLGAEGAEAVGVDPSPDAVARAERLAPAARFVQAGGEALPFGNAAFDAVLFVNALHHVPAAAMDAALGEAARVVTPAGAVIVIEPLAEGGAFRALRLIEDETAVRAAAQEALARAVDGGVLRLVRTIRYTRREAFGGVDAFLENAIAVDPARRAAVAARHATIAAEVLAAGRSGEGKLVLDQPTKADIFARVG